MEDSVVSIDNLEEMKSFFQSIAFESKYGQTIIFTNGNDWYIDTLIRNLLFSYDKWNTRTDRKIGVVCTDDKAYEKAHSLGMACFNLKSADLGVGEMHDSLEYTSYLRLCYVKTVVTYYCLLFGYFVIYIDPDMSFNLQKENIDFIDNLIEGNGAIEYTFQDYKYSHSPVTGEAKEKSEYEALFCGQLSFRPGAQLCCIKLNTNLMVIRPSEYTRKLFCLTLTDLNNYTSDLNSCGDEDFIDRFGREPKKMKFFHFTFYPGGSDNLKNKHSAFMFHANRVTGLENKIKLLKECGGWYLNE